MKKINKYIILPIRNLHLLMQNQVKGLVNSRLSKSSALLFLSGAFCGFLGFAFQILAGRLLGVEEYGVLSAVMATFLIFATPLGTLSMIIVRKISEYRATKKYNEIRHFYYWINIRSIFIGLFLLSIFIFYSNEIMFYLKLKDTMPVYFLGILIFFNILPTINNAVLQGQQRFIWLSISGLITILLKILFSVWFIWLGYGILGILVGTLIAIALNWVITYKILFSKTEIIRGRIFMSPHLSYKKDLPVFFANFAFAVVTQLDIALVNYYFSAKESSEYAAAAILGKAVLYFSSGIIIAFFPMVAEVNERKFESLNLLYQAIILTVLLNSIFVVVYFFFGEAIVQIFYGENYNYAGEILRYYGIAIFPMSLVILLEYYYIAKGKIIITYLFFLMVPVLLLAVNFFHESLLMVVSIMGILGFFVVGVGLAFLKRSLKYH